MAVNRLLSMAAAALVACGTYGAAHAQFGFNLPPDDFTWTWGSSFDESRRGLSDFSARGSESGFNCDLTGKLRVSSRYTPADIRQLENDLRVSMFFIQSAANTLNVLDQRRELDWAVLECIKPDSEPDAEKQQQRLDRARERMIEEQRRRRERQQQ